MQKQDALKIIEQALNAATSKGVFNLNDVAYILQAIEFLKQN